MQNKTPYHNIKAIVFDLDDTLINSSSSVVQCFQQVAKEFRQPLPSEHQIRELMGMPLNEFCSSLWPNLDSSIVSQLYLKLFKPDLLQAIPHVEETLKILKERGFDLHILSSKVTLTIHKHLRYTNIPENLFISIMGGDAVAHPKPDPRVFTYLLKSYAAHEILYVGDSLYDFQAASSAKIPFIAVLTGIHSKSTFSKLGCPTILTNVNKVLPLLEEKV
jgi:phosphoglycolate phosphatase-like HAD superfamily hydrolase